MNPFIQDLINNFTPSNTFDQSINQLLTDFLIFCQSQDETDPEKLVILYREKYRK